MIVQIYMGSVNLVVHTMRSSGAQIGVGGGTPHVVMSLCADVSSRIPTVASLVPLGCRRRSRDCLHRLGLGSSALKVLSCA